MRPLFFIALALALGTIATPAPAQEFKGGDITIDKAWARATPKGAEVGAGYFVVHNHGDTPDRLTGGSADFARVEIHEMKTESHPC
jgi:copper(I)-binding protein